MDFNKRIDAVEIGEQTLVGSFGDFPRKHGNCFGLITEEGKNYRIVNFIVENLEEALERGLEWPIKIIPITERTAIIHDERIPHDWYMDRWCEVCCPHDLLPIPQKLRQDREIKYGTREEYVTEINGKPVTMVKSTIGGGPKLEPKE
jgi:hypothetical protein